MTKEALLAELAGNTWVMIRPSPIEGIGVFALRDISKGCREMFSKANDQEQWIKISRAEVELLPEHAKALIGNYCLYDEDHYFVPDYGFKKMDLVNFLNHSDTPNVISINEGEFFEAIRDIKEGEELVIDYGEIVDGE
ncbi:MAG TPA: SET domain-containing protein-lysine N-methyltransferase [Ferruginibacter sp.]|jgi:SET domain-containing protein|nr:SET domain-containing protein-lysine N-methyltransferase [Ferruginibacter sp.]